MSPACIESRVLALCGLEKLRRSGVLLVMASLEVARLTLTLARTGEDLQIWVLGHDCQAYAMRHSCAPASYMAVKHGLVWVSWIISPSCSWMQIN